MISPEESAGQQAPNISALPPPPEPTPLEKLNQVEIELAAAKAECAQWKKRSEEAEKYLAELDANPFILALRNIDAGAVLDDAGKEVKTVTEAVHRLGTKGSVTVKLGFAIMDNVADAITIDPTVTAVKPKQKVAKGIFFADADGNLSRNNPNQGEFGFAGDATSSKRGPHIPDPFLR